MRHKIKIKLPVTTRDMLAHMIQFVYDVDALLCLSGETRTTKMPKLYDMSVLAAKCKQIKSLLHIYKGL